MQSPGLLWLDEHANGNQGAGAKIKSRYDFFFFFAGFKFFPNLVMQVFQS